MLVFFGKRLANGVYLNQEAENMEVHHHAHHGGMKSWKVYFWEFFMLFLAVFCGFLAEYKLEHVIEHQREKKYIHSLVKDVELDIAALQNSYDLRKTQILYFDSLTALLKRGYNGRMNDFYFYARHITRSTNFEYHDRTILQLKNSGNLRLIRNDEAADSITIYDNEKIKALLIQQENELEFRKHITLEIVGKILNAFVWKEMIDSTGQLHKPVNDPSLITNDPSLINQFSFDMVALNAGMTYTNRLISQVIASAKNLIALLKKKYHWE